AVRRDEAQERVRGASTPYRVPEIRGARDVRQRPELVALAGVIGGLAGVGLNQRWLVVTGVAVAFCGLVLQVWFRLRANRLAGSLASALAAGDRPQVFGALSGVLQDASSAGWVALVGWPGDGMGGEIQLARGDGPPEFVLMSWLVREAESRDDLLATARHEFA